MARPSLRPVEEYKERFNFTFAVQIKKIGKHPVSLNMQHAIDTVTQQ